MHKPQVSFEFHPPRGLDDAPALWRSVATLSALSPAFVTMTYKAGGSGGGDIVALGCALKEVSAVPTAAHLTFISTPRDELLRTADRLWQEGVRHIVALRGDRPEGGRTGRDNDYFATTVDFIKALKAQHPFEISVAAHPETHPDALSAEADLDWLRAKCDAGADRALTQVFFDNGHFYNFRDRAARARIDVPILPGVAPVANGARLKRLSDLSQVNTPGWLTQRFSAAAHDKAATAATAEAVIAEQVRDLAAHGAGQIHIYTLNQTALPLAACAALGIVPPN